MYEWKVLLDTVLEVCKIGKTNSVSVSLDSRAFWRWKSCQAYWWVL